MPRLDGPPVRVHVWGHTDRDADIAEGDARFEAMLLRRPVKEVIRVVGGKASEARAGLPVGRPLRCDRSYDREYLIVAYQPFDWAESHLGAVALTRWIAGRWR